MADNLPYMVAYSRLGEILERIKSAQTPDRFTPDFLSTKLGFPKAADKAAISLLKRMGFLRSDGSPTERYNQFRNPNPKFSGAAMAEGIRAAYDQLFERNEYANEMSDKDLRGLLVEITGAKSGSVMVKRIAGTFKTLLEYADFEGQVQPEETPAKESHPPTGDQALQIRPADSVGMNVSYTINLNLPPTSDVAVFNAIFTALRENLLKGMR